MQNTQQGKPDSIGMPPSAFYARCHPLETLTGNRNSEAPVVSLEQEFGKYSFHTCVPWQEVVSFISAFSWSSELLASGSLELLQEIWRVLQGLNAGCQTKTAEF